jgi:hypothetical protein
MGEVAHLMLPETGISSGYDDTMIGSGKKAIRLYPCFTYGISLVNSDKPIVFQNSISMELVV